MPSAKKTPPAHHKKAPSTSPSHKYNEVETLLSWTAPGRPFTKKHRSYYVTTLLLTLFIEIILFLFSQYMLMLVVISLIFVAFALASTPPHDFHYRISTEGVFVEDYFFLWQELYDFYFSIENGEHVLKIRTLSFYPGEVMLTLGTLSPHQVQQVLLPFLPFREYIKPTFMDNAGKWLSKTFPLETEESNSSHHHKVA